MLVCHSGGGAIKQKNSDNREISDMWLLVMNTKASDLWRFKMDLKSIVIQVKELLIILKPNSSSFLISPSVFFLQ